MPQYGLKRAGCAVEPRAVGRVVAQDAAIGVRGLVAERDKKLAVAREGAALGVGIRRAVGERRPIRPGVVAHEKIRAGAIDADKNPLRRVTRRAGGFIKCHEADTVAGHSDV